MKTKTNREGSALVLVLGLIIIGALLCTGILAYASNNARLAQREFLMEQALHTAEAGVELAAQYIVDRDAYLYQNITSIEGSLNGGSYSGIIQKEGFRDYSIAITGTVSGLSRAVTIDEVYVATFAKFGWWSEVNGTIWFIPGDVLFGHVHTDDYLRFSATSGRGPAFEGDLTSKKDWYYLTNDGASYQPSTRAPAESAGVEFHEGFDLDSPHGSMADVKWTPKRTLAADPGYADGLFLEGYTEITIHGNEMEVYNPRAGIDHERLPIHGEQLVYVADFDSSDPGYVVMNGGTLDGQMTIYSENDVYLKDHIVYQNDPRDDDLPEVERDYYDESDDKLGIVSRDDIWVHPDAPNNLNIFAAMMATGAVSDSNDGKFGVYDYSSRPPSGDLTVYGSIVQEVRGAVGTFNSRGLSTGFYKDYMWDDRFERGAPPHYPPLDDSIIMVGWGEHAVANHAHTTPAYPDGY